MVSVKTANNQGPRAIEAYEADAESFTRRYEAVRFEDVHRSILDLIPDKPSKILDVGAGSGRDAAALADRGHNVLAVEPSRAMRTWAQTLHSSDRIRWIDDALPDLSKVFGLGQVFDVILLSAVWMHLAPGKRYRSIQALKELLREDGLLIITLRIGPPDERRQIHSVDVDEIKELGASVGLHVVRSARESDQLGRQDVAWATVVFSRFSPDNR